MEGSCNARYGYIVLVTSVTDVGPPMIADDGTAAAKFRVTYDCVVMRPFKGEVIDCVVTQATVFGVHASAGPMAVFVSKKMLPPDHNWSGENSAWVSDDGLSRIEKNGEIRVRIVGWKADGSSIYCIATLNGNYLGSLNETI